MLPPGRSSCRAPGPSTTLWSSPITWIASAIGEIDWVALTAAKALPRVRGECLGRPDVGDDIDQRAADFGSPVGIGAVARCAALAEPGKGADRQQHEQSQRGSEMPLDRRQDHHCRTEIGTYRGDV